MEIQTANRNTTVQTIHHEELVEYGHLWGAAGRSIVELKSPDKALEFDRYLSERIVPRDSSGIKAYTKELVAYVSELTGTPTSDITQAFHVELVQRLNAKPWGAQRTQHKSAYGSGDVINEYVPLNQAFAFAYPGAQHFAGYGSSGKSSGSIKVVLSNEEDNRRVTNGWLTTLKQDDETPLFEAIRSGTLVHYGEKDPDLRRERSRAMASELLKAAASVSLSKLSDAARQAVMSGVQPLAVNISSFDLQTSGAPEGHSLELENGIVRESRQLLTELEGVRELRLSVPTSTGSYEINIPALVSIKVFNFPVHEKSFIEQIGWEGEIAEHNDRATRSLLEEAVSYLDSNPSGDREPQKKYSKIYLLVDEIQRLMDDRGYRQAFIDPYAINSRLMNLAYLLGYTVHFNCRSGKDRSGLVDAEAKLIATMLESATVPNYRRSIDRAESDFLFSLAAEGGSSTIQRLSTGVTGSKLKPISGTFEGDKLVARIGEHNWTRFKGNSSLASV